ncbi:MAG: response regulator transcription factor [Bacteroidetes bacterium]|nr:response regulator transcription factor [Bacteroidota bacterium]
MRVVIIEDEKISQDFLVYLLKKKYPDIDILKVIDSVKDSIEFFMDNDADLIFMDIHLKDGDCFQIFEKINLNLPIIFTTAYDEYTLKAFDVNGIAYILKPLSEESITNAISKYKKITSQSLDKEKINYFLSSIRDEKKYKKRLLVRLGDKIIVIEESNIAYFISKSRITYVYTKENDVYIIDYSLDSLSVQLDPNNFFRISRECIARFDSIADISKFTKGRLKVTLAPELQSEIIISQERTSYFYKWIIGENH